MTREEKIELLEFVRQGLIINARVKSDYDIVEALGTAISALKRPPREQVEKMRGEWIIEDAGDGDRRKKCSLCNQSISGWWGRDRFCANCGAPMTDEAVQMVMERLEALYEEN